MAEIQKIATRDVPNPTQEQQIAEIAMLIDEVARDVRKIKRYFILTFVLGLAVTIIPLIGIMIALPYLYNAMTSMYNVNGM